MLLNQVMRYIPAIDYLRRMDPGSVLEVGSGSKGLGPYWDRPTIGCDLQFDGPLHPNLIGIVASAMALPFCDGAFDCVCSLDTIEHIPVDKRQAALIEMGRVASRWIVVAFPLGKQAEMSDRAVRWFYDWRGGAAPPWLSEHFQQPFPNGSEIKVLAQNSNWNQIETGNENIFAHFLEIILETRGWFYRNGAEFVRRHPWLISVFSIRPCYRRFYFLEKRAD